MNIQTAKRLHQKDIHKGNIIKELFFLKLEKKTLNIQNVALEKGKKYCARDLKCVDMLKFFCISYVLYVANSL